MNARRGLVAWILVVAWVGGALAQPPLAPPAEPRGSLVIVGGGTMPASVRDEFIRLAGGPKARLVVIPTASEKADADAALQQWKAYKLADLQVLHTRDRKQADDATFTAALAQATAVWFGGGDQTKLTDAYLGTRVQKELQALLERGGVIGGTSAGAAVMSKAMIAGGNPTPKMAEGFGLLPHAIVDQHFGKRERGPRLVAALKQNPGLFGLGIDEGTAVIVQGRLLTVRGDAKVVLVQSAGGGRKLLERELKAGDKADLLAESRAALARTQEPWPPLKPAAPAVAKGTLVIGGGGGMPAEVWKRFLEAAGGAKAHIVYIPTAEQDPLPKESGELKKLKSLGAASVVTLHTRSRAEADTEAFVAPLQKATAVWIGGGRQWRLVDSYLGTRTEKELHALLARGGLVGGSSAGASIQSDYMVRGDPLGNLKPMAEGYERGLSFITGLAIDQHFFKRKRTADMTAVMAAHPQLLGLGLDEQTAVVVQGELLEVVGASKIAIYDRTQPLVEGQPDYIELTAGMRYNVKTRKKLEAADRE